MASEKEDSQKETHGNDEDGYGYRYNSSDHTMLTTAEYQWYTNNERNDYTY